MPRSAILHIAVPKAISTSYALGFKSVRLAIVDLWRNQALLIRDYTPKTS